jgi:hypothetical protein
LYEYDVPAAFHPHSCQQVALFAPAMDKGIHFTWPSQNSKLAPPECGQLTRALQVDPVAHVVPMGLL